MVGEVVRVSASVVIGVGPIMLHQAAAVAVPASTSVRIRALRAVVLMEEVELYEIDSGECGSGSERLWT
jgi:hypothetical protein